MSTFNLLERMQSQKRIQELEQEVQTLKEALNQQAHIPFTFDSSDFVNSEYFMESQHIHDLKKKITVLISQNDILKTKNRELIEEIEYIRGNKIS